MWAHLLAMAGSAAAAAPGIPAISALAVSSGNAGTCPASSDPAAVHIAWSVTNGGNPAYEIHVLENGTLVSTLASNAAFWNKTVAGYIEGTGVPHFSSSWDYTVQLVRLADGVVVQTLTAPTWTKSYQSC